MVLFSVDLIWGSLGPVSGPGLGPRLGLAPARALTTPCENKKRHFEDIHPKSVEFFNNMVNLFKIWRPSSTLGSRASRLVHHGKACLSGHITGISGRAEPGCCSMSRVVTCLCVARRCLCRVNLWFGSRKQVLSDTFALYLYRSNNKPQLWQRRL